MIKDEFSGVVVFDIELMEVITMDKEYRRYHSRFWGERKRLVSWSGEIPTGSGMIKWEPNSFFCVDLT